ncbi:MAG TPA: tetratricopeptide repeat protein [Rhizomicrobium sp.]
MAGNRNDAEIRAALIAAARAQVGRGDSPYFNIKVICEEVGIDRAEFRRFFPGREALVASVLEEDVEQLQALADSAAVEPRVALAVGNGAPVAAAAPPAPDAWLERRLRVFERSLAGLEARQEKTEQLLNRSVALIEEKIVQPAAEPAPPAPAMVEPPRHHAPDVVPGIAPVQSVAPVSKAIPMPALEPDPPPVSPKEMDDLLSNARRVAREAAVEPPAPKRKRMPRLMPWAAAVCLALMAVTAAVFASLAGAAADRAGDSHRQVAAPAAQIAALAAHGDARSQTELAYAYLNGRQGAADPIAALRWGLAAARQGVPMAQYLVATLYQGGSGVDADARQAFQWFEAAALRGNVKAMHDLAIAYAEGQGTAHDASRAAAWFNRAAKQGYVDSQFDLAVLYERGDGVRQNAVSALKWYLVAAAAGDAPAKLRAAQLAREMPAADVTRAKAQAQNFATAERDSAANTL